MRRMFYWISIILFLLWTVLIFVGVFNATPDQHQLGWMNDAEKAGTFIGMVVVLFTWAIVAVPLGIFAMVVKPRD
jgi:hypothetical protein